MATNAGDGDTSGTPASLRGFDPKTGKLDDRCGVAVAPMLM